MTLTHQGTKTIYTRRLLLRKFRHGDEQRIFDNVLGDPRLTKYVNWDAQAGLEMTDNFLHMHLIKYELDKSFYAWGIEKDGRIIGSVSAFHVDNTIQSCEIGYSLGSRFWGRGIITEAVTAVLDYLFNEIGFNRITATYYEENIASGKVMKKVGMSYEATCREAALHKDGILGKLILYSILKSDFNK